MKVAWITLSIGAVLLILFFSRAQLWVRKATIDIHVHDTYFIVPYLFLILFFFLFLGTFFTLGGLVGTSFRNKYFIGAFIFFALADAYFIVQYLGMFR